MITLLVTALFAADNWSYSSDPNYEGFTQAYEYAFDLLDDEPGAYHGHALLANEVEAAVGDRYSYETIDLAANAAYDDFYGNS